MAFHSCLSTECSCLVLKGFPIEFHAELKNELFVQGRHIYYLTVHYSFSICDRNKLFAAI